MNLWQAIRTKALVGLDPESLRFWQYHIKTRDGKLGWLEGVRRCESRSVTMVTLRHFNGEPFDQEYAAAYCDLLERR